VLSQVTWKPGDSHFWASLMATKKHFFCLGTFSIKDGSEILFWEDTWLGNTTHREQYLNLYEIFHHKGDNMMSRRDLLGPRISCWNALLQRLATIQLTCGKDKFRWNLHEIGMSQWLPCTMRWSN
jgi:hypothetical protein